MLGLVSISFRALSPEALITLVKAAKLSCIEWGSDVHAPCTDEAALNKIIRLQAESGIACCSYGTYFRLGQNPLSELPEYIRAAKKLGTHILRLWCGTKGSSDYTPQELEALYGECRRAAALAEAEDVTLCMECHNGTLTDRKEAALALMEAVSSPSFRMYWQPNQHRTPEENCAYAAALAPYITHIHVFNWEGANRYPLAESIDLWKKYLQILGKNHTLLLEFMPDDDPNSLPREADALRAIIGGCL